MSKNIIISGASRGIGYQTAKILADAGNSVVALSRSVDRLNELREAGDGKISVLSLDLTHADAPGEIANFLRSRNMKLDGIIHNAGLLISKAFIELTDSDWQRQWELNVMVPVRLTRELLPFLNPGAHIVNIGSMGGFQGSSKYQGLSAYSATKAALSSLTESLSAELADFDIAVNCLCLGAVQTEMLEQAFPGYTAPLKPEKMGEFIANFTLESHHYINGKVLPVSLNNP